MHTLALDLGLPPGGRLLFSPLSVAWHALFDLWSSPESVIESGGLVSEWRDISGSNRHITQGTGSLKPAVSGSGAARVISFDGLDDRLTRTSMGTMSTGSVYFAYCTPDPTTQINAFACVASNDLTAGEGIRNEAALTGNNWLNTNTGDWIRNVSGSTPGYMRINGTDNVLAHNKSAHSFWAVMGDNYVRAGAGDCALGGNLAGRYWKGTCQMFSIRMAMPDLDVVQRVEAYAHWQAGTPHLLPAAHPFRNSPP